MTFSDTLSVIGVSITAIGGIATVVSLLSVLRQIRVAQQVARGEFLLHLTELLQEHEATHRVLLIHCGQTDVYRTSG